MSAPSLPMTAPPASGALAEQAGSLQALADRCVQCGLCLPACPTYARDRIEAESPRGRIALARTLAAGTLAPTPLGEAHLDHCLGCRSCEAVCPAGVEYGRLLTVARMQQRRRRPPGRLQRLAEDLVARPVLLGRLLGLYRTVFPALPAGLRPLPRPPAAMDVAGTATGERPSIAVFTGCIAGVYEVPLRAALARLLAALDLAMAPVRGQTCCGSLHAHGGDAAGARSLAEANHTAFAGCDTVLTLASGCHAAVAAAMPAGTAAVDAVAFLHRHAERLRFGDAASERIALHIPCTQRNVTGSDRALRALLARVPGLETVELDPGLGCCGAAGLQMLAEPARAAGYREPLLAQLRQSGATRLLSANIGCRLHLAAAAAMPVQHPLELLAERLRH
ncbi:(Fe-S)-binding protein [Marilutibacter chinensis]|uniref:Glycolate oxidase iron-sulfur subunit n=1 Tax=Marilutibacter chinensis TaxID=2912247 RepID=A0ABS9HS43_9GAMM|nr:(Fe-S)-binding protein [Lysobacter chinensis]MCF7221336.1 (Fe-S)-binding protein [Lysobacter chinensis]